MRSCNLHSAILPFAATRGCAHKRQRRKIRRSLRSQLMGCRACVEGVLWEGSVSHSIDAHLTPYDTRCLRPPSKQRPHGDYIRSFRAIKKVSGRSACLVYAHIPRALVPLLAATSVALQRAGLQHYPPIMDRSSILIIVNNKRLFAVQWPHLYLAK